MVDSIIISISIALLVIPGIWVIIGFVVSGRQLNRILNKDSKTLGELNQAQEQLDKWFLRAVLVFGGVAILGQIGRLFVK